MIRKLIKVNLNLRAYILVNIFTYYIRTSKIRIYTMLHAYILLYYAIIYNDIHYMCVYIIK